MNLTRMGIAAITFDLDDTLWECAPVINQAEQVYYDWLREHCPAVCEEHDIAGLRVLRQRLLDSAPELINDVSEWRRRSTTELLSRYGGDVGLTEDAFNSFLHARQAVEFYPEVISALQSLSQHYRLGSLTNGNADLQHIGAKHYFDCALYATLDLPAKPAPDMYLKASAELGVPLHSILHVGDNALTDIEGARRAGCRTAWINRGSLVFPPDLEPADLNITSLDELVALAPEVRA